LDGELRFFDNRSGQRVAYYESRCEAPGPEHQRPLVLLHSINAAASAYEVRPLFDRFAPSRPTFALEWPGFGQSQRGQMSYGVRLYADTLREFLQRVKQRHGAADVVALSLSAEHAALVAQERPELYASLTLISPTGLGLQAPRARRPSRLLSWLLHDKPWSHPLFCLLCSHASLRYYLSKSFCRHDPDEGLVAYAYETSHQPGAEHAPLAFVAGRFAVPEVFRRVYAALLTPTLILYDQDAYTSFERIEELVLRNPVFTPCRIPHSLGLPHWDEPEQTFAALSGHWQRCSPESPQPADDEADWLDEPSAQGRTRRPTLEVLHDPEDNRLRSAGGAPLNLNHHGTWQRPRRPRN